ncbi:MAG: hypothetical protein QNL62_25350 [Gammaproteobacteria bacterium]|nr:hypothetical protein [Gammaproteobacteria bacterium]
MALGVDPSHPDIVNNLPRWVDVRILTLRHLGNLAIYGASMAVGTLSVLVLETLFTEISTHSRGKMLINYCF